MKKETFVNIHKPDWDSLNSLTVKIEKKGFKSLSSSEIKDFLHLFRLTSHNLSHAKTHYGQCDLTSYLNGLVGRSHNYIYSVKRFSLKEIWNYFSFGFPNLLRKNKVLILISTLVFFFGFLASLLLVLEDSSWAGLFLPESFIQSASSELGAQNWNSALMSSQIMLNNISVSFKAFVFGLTLGIGTFYVLFMNGTLLGALTALVYMNNNPIHYWSLILPHGVIELTAIFISGGAGFIVAKSFILPGDFKRKDSLIKGSLEGISLFGGVVIMLIIAGLIEGFYTPLSISANSKLIFAALTALLLILYFSLPYWNRRKLKKKSMKVR